MVYVFITLLTALSISSIAIYYSVAGLIAIFAAAPVPIILMGGTLEIAKLVTAVWLHRFWSQAAWWLRGYLSIAVIVLMFITSMGIFGFLSKAHIEQTSANDETIAQTERIDNEITRYKVQIEKSEQNIIKLESKGTGGQAVIQSQIDREQERIDAAYARIQPLVNEQNKIITSATELYQTELNKIDQNLALLQTFINNGEVAKAQGMVGTKADGKYGPNTAAAFTAYQDQKSAERQEWLDKIQNASNTDTVKQAKEEIARLRAQAEKQIEESNNLITSYKAQLQSTEAKDVSSLITEESNRIKILNSELDELIAKKFELSTGLRKLEAEVGPIKYIAEMVYGESADKNILEKAVRWVIITLIFVFDPLAVILLIASQYTIAFIKPNAKHSKPSQIYINETEIEAEEDTKPVENLVILQARQNSYLEKEKIKGWKEAKTRWKNEHPEENLKDYKSFYLQGSIEKLPWEIYLDDK